MLCWCSSCSDDWIFETHFEIAEHKLSLSLSLDDDDDDDDFANVPSRRVRLCVLLLLLSFAPLRLVSLSIYIYRRSLTPPDDSVMNNAPYETHDFDNNNNNNRMDESGG